MAFQQFLWSLEPRLLRWKESVAAPAGMTCQADTESILGSEGRPARQTPDRGWAPSPGGRKGRVCHGAQPGCFPPSLRFDCPLLKHLSHQHGAVQSAVCLSAPWAGGRA